MALDELRLFIALENETWTRYSAAVHDEPQPEELVKCPDNKQERDNCETRDLENLAKHSSPSRHTEAPRHRGIETAYCVLRAAACLLPIA